MGRRLVVALLLPVLSGCANRHAAPAAGDPPPAAREAAATPGFDVLEVGLPPGEDPQGVVRVVAARGDLGHVQARVAAGPAARAQWRTARQVAHALGALAVINGGYFDKEDHPLGLIIADGVHSSPLRQTDWGVLLIRDNRARIVHTKECGSLDGVRQALQCGPRLVAAGKPLKLKPSMAEPRSAVGIDGQGRLLLVATSKGGLRLDELAALLARSEADGGLGCQSATNLDGGPSTQLSIPGHAEIPGAYAMPTHLALLPGEGSPPGEIAQ
jgi:uncharacterized protein YigE (DUF2233 family)